MEKSIESFLKIQFRDGFESYDVFLGFKRTSQNKNYSSPYIPSKVCCMSCVQKWLRDFEGLFSHC